MRVVQYGVHDPSYPRNARVRAFLTRRLGADVVVVARARGGLRATRLLRDLRGLWRASCRAEVVVLSEFRLTHAPIAWAVARLRRATLVVDHFVGLHETVVEDWQDARRDGFRARRLAVQDRVAARLADICTTDTDARASNLERLHGRPVLALPVGAPDWAVQLPAPDHDRTRGPHVLYYGNYLPLHGVDVVVDALVVLARDTPFRATFIGNGVARAAVERTVADGGIAGHCTFIDQVDEPDLASYIGAADVVLGVFGRSQKAIEVVPNKVWQGLACGRVVVTQEGPAVRRLADVVGDQLVLVDRDDHNGIAAAVLVADPQRARRSDRVHEVLESHVDAAFEALATALLARRRS